MASLVFRSRAPRCAVASHLVGRDREHIDYGSLAVDSFQAVRRQFFRLASRLVVCAREVFEVLRLRQKRKHGCL